MEFPGVGSGHRSLARSLFPEPEDWKRQQLRGDRKSNQNGNGFLVKNTHQRAATEPGDAEYGIKNTEGGAALVRRDHAGDERIEQ